ncbi:endonuclease/exonuclease/phosphatase family protein [Candidatus Daviesbacteria bacterium]|nr:endonuclease/exonuclease/phosphatase family protein [Candidatus Daviesbacteria bacterium]
MKLISLNIWGGKYFDPLIDFIKQHKDTDIFCFQEIIDTKSNIKESNEFRANLLSEIKKILTDYQTFYFPVVEGFDFGANPVDFDLSFGQAIFLNNSIKILSHEDYFIYKEENFQILEKDFSNLPTPLQYISILLDNKVFAIFNFHGRPIPGDKLDTKDRLMEAKKTKEIIDKKTGGKVLVGDFNLLPQTESIKIFQKDMRNLIAEFNIKRTRSRLSPFFGKTDFQKFADFTFVSSDVNVLDFKVPDITVSDHLPMILEFS